MWKYQDCNSTALREEAWDIQYFVLRKDLLYLYRTFLWDDLSEMMKYLGLEDEVNSYALLGFSSLRVNEVG